LAHLARVWPTFEKIFGPEKFEKNDEKWSILGYFGCFLVLFRVFSGL
jgi:hypothetical protein